MRKLSLIHVLLLACLALAVRVFGQGFSSGSDGSYGPLGPEQIPDGSITTLDMPEDGIFRCTSITIRSRQTQLIFKRNRLNTPVYLLATEEIDIQGTIYVDGENQTSRAGGKGGPGGFDGGSPSLFVGDPPGAGHGPGGGLGGPFGNTPESAGQGAYGTPTLFLGSSGNGKVYGSPLLVPLVGGSGGGGGTPIGLSGVGYGGGGGGGAILLASDVSVSVSGFIYARGGWTGVHSYATGGSGGAIRIVAPVVAGNGQLHVRGGGGRGGDGRIRIDAINKAGATFVYSPDLTVVSAGTFLAVFPDVVPKLDLVEVAGRAIPEGTTDPVEILLPFGSSPSRTILVQARNFTGLVPIDVVLTPEHGDRIIYPAEIDMTDVPAGEARQVMVNVEIPINTVVHVHAWTRSP